MNTTSFEIFTDHTNLIDRLKEAKVPVIKEAENLYLSVVPVYAEAQLCNLISNLAEERLATVFVRILYQDPGTGESSKGYIAYINGKKLRCDTDGDATFKSEYDDFTIEVDAFEPGAHARIIREDGVTECRVAEVVKYVDGDASVEPVIDDIENYGYLCTGEFIQDDYCYFVALCSDD